MAKGNNQKLKLLYLAKIFERETDEEHGLTMPQITEKLKKYEVSADRKTLYQDLNELREFGMDIIDEREGKSTVYKLVSRDFELAELKMLVDAVQSSKFLTERQSREMIKKLEQLASDYEAKQLQRQVVLPGRIKTKDESIFYTVDKLNNAINSNKQISFKYFNWNVKKEKEYRHDGASYHVSPWHLVWDDENYYLIAYDNVAKMKKHFRIDKMSHISLVDKPREGKDELENIDIADYAKSVFGMHGGEKVKVTLRGEMEMTGVIIDRFGKDIIMYDKGDGTFEAAVNVVPSNIFYGWILGLGGKIKIVSPPPIVGNMKKLLKAAADQYK